eukprot:CCRYP_004376-RA/>CCRYP_004376-RA protein AED:0.17 eAED:0.17 QI:0/0.28/0.12/1/1/1/8/0/752
MNPPTKVPTKSPTGSIVTFGALSNFDTYCVVPKSLQGEYEECHGFEIELEGLSCSNVYYTFSYNRYGTPNKTDTATGGCIVTYASGYDDVGSQWLVTTPIPFSLLQGGRVTPTGGHSCFSSGQADYATSGCEHFGVSLGGGSGPTATKYRWLIAHPTEPKTLMTSTTRVGIPAVSWSVNAGAGAGGGNVIAAAIAAEPQDDDVHCACAKWGEPKWVKVFVTEIEYECDLDHLLTDSDEVPQSKNETEMEWVLLQARPTCDGECNPKGLNETENELESSKEAGDGTKSIIRRYEFYEYTGEVNVEDNEAQPACEKDPESCDSVGNYLGAQMAAVVIGLGDSLNIATQSPVMTGREGVAYILMLTAVGGTPPYIWSLNSGTLFNGLDLSSDGFITGTPTESGDRTLEIKVVDADDTPVLKFLNLTIVSLESPSQPPMTTSPTTNPTKKPTLKPTLKPTKKPTKKPTMTPTTKSTLTPTLKTTSVNATSLSPTRNPTMTPTMNPPTKVPTKSPTGSIVTFGALSNFDTYCVVPKSLQGEYEECHGFEIELEGLSCSNVYYTFSYNRYGTPNKTDTATGGCIVTYASGYDDVGSQADYATSGCIPAVSWSVNAGAGAGGGNVIAAAIAAEPQDDDVHCACAKWGEPKWVKVFVTEIEYECDLDHLLTDSDEVPQSKNETEMEHPTESGDRTLEIKVVDADDTPVLKFLNLTIVSLGSPTKTPSKSYSQSPTFFDPTLMPTLNPTLSDDDDDDDDDN